MVQQTEDFISNQLHKDEMEMDMDEFSMWLNVYPFIRTQIRESMMPKIWTLDKDYAVKQAPLHPDGSYTGEKSPK